MGKNETWVVDGSSMGKPVIMTDAASKWEKSLTRLAGLARISSCSVYLECRSFDHSIANPFDRFALFRANS